MLPSLLTRAGERPGDHNLDKIFTGKQNGEESSGHKYKHKSNRKKEVVVTNTDKARCNKTNQSYMQNLIRYISNILDIIDIDSNIFNREWYLPATGQVH